MKFSVIIPFANAQETIRACLDSVIVAADRLDAESPASGVEIICINGGCEDQSVLLVDEYAQKDVRIAARTSRPEVKGAGPARNAGIERATGDYLAFVDADDAVDPDLFVRLKDSTADIVTFLSPEGVFDLQERHARRMTFSPMVGNLLVWNAIYRREMIGDWRFPNLKNHQDLVWTCGAYARAKTLVGGVLPWYHYDERVSGSAVNSHSWRRVAAAWTATFLMWRAVRPAFVGNGISLRLVMLRKMTMHLVLHCFKEIPLAVITGLKGSD